jgi:DsbC/DsbD-like thiol-disulfide interchange protein/cytochrome c biogenesis protein CcdA
MIRTIVALLCMAVTLLLQPAARAQVPGERHVAIELVPETARPAAGGTVTLAFVSTPAKGWHAYWKNGGDAGVETRLAWTLPQGVTAGALQYPVPGRLLVSGLMNYVYEKPFVQFVELTLPRGLAAGTRLPVIVVADYLVCTEEICVPEKATLSTELTVGDGAIEPATRARFDQWRQALPKPLGSQASWQGGAGQVRIAVPFPAAAALGRAYFYPLTHGPIDYAAPQTVTRDGDRLVVTVRGKGVSGGGAGPIEGVLATGDERGLLLTAVPGAVAAVDATPEPFAWGTLLAALGGAVLGGLLLNVMPCVFPILSLKALSLARAGEDEAHARREGLAYTAGVVAVCLGLGAAILGLRAGGSAVGWAFQLQSPATIAVLLALSVAIAANLSGLWDVPGMSFERQGGQAGAFATGALAAFVATPCSGPFMGAALGAALVLPWPAALAVFGGLGLGLALPFLLLGFVPALRRRLPRPGAWMERLRRWLAVPMWLTVAALVWLLARQTGWWFAAVLAVAIGMAGLLWLAGKAQRQGHGRRAAAVGGILAVLTLFVAVRAGTTTAARPADALPAGAAAFSEARLASLRAEGKPVFVYFTADWCLTCKVNERVAIDTDQTADAFRDKQVAVLVGDWTDGNPALGRFIERHNRAGVPLYLWYGAGAAEPRVLPQVLTPAMLAGLAG